MTRVFVCVLDGCGAGALPDAAAYGDEGSDTLRHVLERVDVPLPNLAGARPRRDRRPAARSAAPRGDLRSPARARRRQGHDHRPLGDDGRRARAAVPDLSRRLPARGRSSRSRRRSAGGVLCNRPASGTGIIDELGDEHVAHRPADRLHVRRLRLPDRLPRGRRARVPSSTRGARRRAAILRGPHAVGRVIARPFDGASGHYARTPRRRDYSLEPPGPTYLDLLQERGVPVVGVGKIGEIFVQRGVRRRRPHHRQHGRHRRLHAAPARDGGRAAVRQPRRLRLRVGPPQRRRRASPAGWRRSTPRFRPGRRCWARRTS